MLKDWLLASRPKTLVASLLPVVAGFLLAYEQSDFVSKGVGMLCLLYCLLIQVGTNFANDYFDFVKGADSKRDRAPVRMVSSGIIKPRTMLIASCLVFLLSFAVGVYIMLSVNGSRYLLFGLGYTGGPFPLAYNGMGDVFVIIFFGFVAVLTTYYVTSLSANLNWEPNWVLPLGVGFVINNLLVVNNYRDYEEDKKVGKKTLVVLLGKRFGLCLFFIGVLVSTVLTPFLVPSAWTTIFFFFFLIYSFVKLPKALIRSDYDQVLSASAVTVMGYAVSLLLGYLN